jgi:hypothetical protein
VTNFKVLDTLLRNTGLQHTLPTSQLTSKDGVHFVPEGYAILTENIVTRLDSPQDSQMSARKQNSSFWRGFRSKVGAETLTSQRQSHPAQGKAASVRGHGQPRQWSGQHRWQPPISSMGEPMS